MHLTRLRLSGFKSFADPQDFLIEPGLTGIVGPNGCGKSNIVESIRWVMGEGSARQLRGGEMDDVIFAGTNNGMARRPSRNIAEVVLTMDNRSRSAPPAYNDHDEIEISRAIERNLGSSYRINNVPVRAKDVQLLFADVQTGADSTAIVSQGRVGEIISAKPRDRRHLLEEAAGIVGLNTRRHEADLKLKGTTKNLERLDDVLKTYDEQLKSLKKQARHAKGYRKINEDIKRLTAAHLYLKYLDATETREKLAVRRKDVETQLQELLLDISRLTREENELSEALPPLRQKEAAQGAELQRIKLALRDVEAEQARLNERKQQAESALAQTLADLERETGLKQEYEQRLQMLNAQFAEVDASRSQLTDLSAHETELQTLQETVDAAEKTVNELTGQLASQKAHYQALSTQLEAAEAREMQLAEEESQLKETLAAMEPAGDETARLQEMEALIHTTQDELDKLIRQVQKAENRTTELREISSESRQDAQKKQAQLNQIRAEFEALNRLVKQAEAQSGTSLLSQIAAEAGFEVALGAAFRDELNIGEDTNQPLYWHALPDYDKPAALPAGTVPLAEKIKAPRVLARRLAHMGFVSSAAEGDKLWSALQPGQMLVSQDGDVWRWDGLRITPKAAAASTQVLKNKNRLQALQQEIESLEKEVEASESQHNKAEQSLREAIIKERQLREQQKEFYHKLDATRGEVQGLQSYLAETQQDRANAQIRLQQITERLAEIRTDVEDKAARLGKQPDFSNHEAQLEKARGMLHDRRSQLYEKRSQLEQLKTQSTQREREHQRLQQEIAQTSQRLEATSQRLTQLATREEEARAALETIQAAPDTFTDRQQMLLDKITAAEAQAIESANALQEAENRYRTVSQNLKEKERAAGSLREERAKIEAGQEHVASDLDAIARDIQEDVGCAPDQVLVQTDLQESDLSRQPAEVEAELLQLKIRREQYGAVNLMAEEEADNVQAKVDEIMKERADLEQAVAKLRKAISDINRQGRESLQDAFEKVNGYFETLFRRLFGGGKATLSFVDSEDPLEAGLEIMASPPGKRLQSLNLLSGGEKALTAVALLFAVFLTRPAPICVLDEVDAPLDDTNVDRFCTLLEEMSEQTQTRFLVVTHHRMTMARMHRLYGVTMAEAGVSQLVSVNLEQAEHYQQAAE